MIHLIICVRVLVERDATGGVFDGGSLQWNLTKQGAFARAPSPRRTCKASATHMAAMATASPIDRSISPQAVLKTEPRSIIQYSVMCEQRRN